MLKILCTACNTELVSHPTQARSCGCSNLTMIINDKITANDLSLVKLISGIENKKINNSIFSAEELAYQEERRKRKVRRLDYEVR